jgi:hypothetical protein
LALESILGVEVARWPAKTVKKTLLVEGAGTGHAVAVHVRAVAELECARMN